MGHLERVTRVVQSVQSKMQLSGTEFDIRLHGKYIMIKNKTNPQDDLYWSNVAVDLQKALYEAFRLKYQVVNTSSTHCSVNCIKTKK